MTGTYSTRYFSFSIGLIKMNETLQELLKALSEVRSAESKKEADEARLSSLETEVAVLKEQLKNINSNLSKGSDTWKWAITSLIALFAFIASIVTKIGG
jgi:predicted nuclease with TOPRIM domain